MQSYMQSDVTAEDMETVFKGYGCCYFYMLKKIIEPNYGIHHVSHSLSLRGTAQDVFF